MLSMSHKWIVRIASICIWLTIIGVGYYAFGPAGAFSSGAFSGIALRLIVGLLNRWPQLSMARRLMTVAVALFSVGGGLYITSVNYGYGFHHVRQRMRDADRLDAICREDDRFASISIAYEDPPNNKTDWLSVRGNVQSGTEFEALRKMVEDGQTWHVEWQVLVLDD